MSDVLMFLVYWEEKKKYDMLLNSHTVSKLISEKANAVL